MLSVIIPVYNGEDYIEETINRILDCSYKDIEIIAVVDGCNDNSLKICNAISEKKPQVKTFFKENGGIARARNYGIERAKGKYIAVCDQDDIVMPDMYRLMIDSMEKNNATMSVCSTAQYINGQAIPLETFDNKVLRGDDINYELLFPTVACGYELPIEMTSAVRYPSVWKCVINREFWVNNNIDYHAYVSFEDDLLAYVRALSLSECVTTIDYLGYMWRVNMDSESHARKFISDIGNKQKMWLDDINKSICYAHTTDEEKDLLLYAMNCQLYVYAVLNICSPYNRIDKNRLEEYFNNTIYDRDFENTIKVARYVSNRFFLQKVIVKALKTKRTYYIYYVSKLLSEVLERVQNSRILMRIDRIIKG